jgi:hypothetical protein
MKKPTLKKMLMDRELEDLVAKGLIHRILLGPDTRGYRKAKALFNKLADNFRLKQLVFKELSKHGFRLRPSRKRERYDCRKLDNT